MSLAPSEGLSILACSLSRSLTDPARFLRKFNQSCPLQKKLRPILLAISKCLTSSALSLRKFHQSHLLPKSFWATLPAPKGILSKLTCSWQNSEQCHSIPQESLTNSAYSWSSSVQSYPLSTKFSPMTNPDLSLIASDQSCLFTKKFWAIMLAPLGSLTNPACSSWRFSPSHLSFRKFDQSHPLF